MHNWKVTYRNDRMGFTKTYAVKASQYIEALELGRALLIGAGYERDDFDVVKLVRLPA